MKQCSKCKQLKPVDEFQRNARNKDGLQAYCRECMNEANRLSAIKHRDAKLARNKRYEAENAEARKAYRAEWRKRNAEKIRKQNAEYRIANKERKAAYLREWQAANPDKVREAVLRRIARRKQAATYVITAKDLRRLMNSPCAFAGCTSSDPIELDHIIPLSRGGTHGAGNLQPLCRNHNRTKHDKLWIEYRAHLARIAA